jgi:histidinol-phosphatase (PHP family)
MQTIPLVSVHGGHSGEFCDHADDPLEAIILRYIDLNYLWIGVTEHTPAITDKHLDPGQKEAGLTAYDLHKKFENYFIECKRLKEKYKEKITIYAAMEIETYTGYKDFVPKMVEIYQPDYFVGSVHFVDDIPIDYSRHWYKKAIESAGSIDRLYARYFDQQYEMIELLNPAVVGHFDLIRIFDSEYKNRIKQPEIMALIERNLALIKERDLIMDLNLRSLTKGADEPYISAPILQRAQDMGISVVPGDDSHGISSVGNFMAQGVDLLTKMNFPTGWQRPRLLTS